jgi:subtilase family serine protease
MDQDTLYGLTFYPDLTPTLTFSNSSPLANQTINIIARIDNTLGGPQGTNLKDVNVKIYVDNNPTPIDSRNVNVSAGSNTTFTVPFSRPAGTYTIKVVVDEDNIKIERNDSNNNHTESVTFSNPGVAYLRGDVNNNGVITSADIISLVNYVFKGGTPPLPCSNSGDVNNNGAITSADVISLVNHVFKGAPAPSPPTGICDGSPLKMYSGEYSYSYVLNYIKQASSTTKSVV